LWFCVSGLGESCTNNDSIAAQPAEPWNIKKDVQKLETNAYGLINFIDFSENSTTKPSKVAFCEHLIVFCINKRSLSMLHVNGYYSQLLRQQTVHVGQITSLIGLIMDVNGN